MAAYGVNLLKASMAWLQRLYMGAVVHQKNPIFTIDGHRNQ